MPEPSTKSPKAYQFMFVLYPESQQPAIDYIQANWPCAWALHDKDTHTEQEFLDYGKHHDGNCPDWQIGDLKKPHYHFVVKFKNARYITGVAKEIRKYSEINDAAIKKCYNLYKAYVYLWHQNDPDKFQYDPEQVVGLHDFDPPQQNEGVTEEEQVETMFNAPVFSTVKELARWAYAIDITNEAAVEALFDDAVATFGRLDVYFTIAGISPVGTAVTTSYEDYKKVVALDMDSVFLGSKYCIPHMIKTGGGVILNLVGTYGIRPTPNKLSYSAAKAGALSITRSVAIDFARDNIRCNAICPGFVNTPLNNGFEGEARQRFLNTYQPAPFEIQAKDIAETALFLASDEARAITGQAIVVDGGTEASLYLNYKRPSADK